MYLKRMYGFDFRDLIEECMLKLKATEGDRYVTIILRSAGWRYNKVFS